MPNSKFCLLTIFLFILIKVNFVSASSFTPNEFEKSFSTIQFNYRVAVNNLKYVESKGDYEQYFSPQVLGYAFDCYKNNFKYFKNAEKQYKVSRFVILAVLSVESYCGHYVSRYNLGEVFKTLTSLKDDKKLVEKVYKRVKKKYPYIKRSWFKKRLKRKIKWANYQLKALKKIFLKYRIDIFNVKSSWAGAFGYPQFLPTTFLYFAVDGDNDGNIDLWSMPDAIFSIASYFNKNGWKEHYGKKRKIREIYKYNHSKLYSEVIFNLYEYYIKNLKR